MLVTQHSNSFVSPCRTTIIRQRAMDDNWSRLDRVDFCSNIARNNELYYYCSPYNDIIIYTIRTNASVWSQSKQVAYNINSCFICPCYAANCIRILQNFYGFHKSMNEFPKFSYITGTVNFTWKKQRLANFGPSPHSAEPVCIAHPATAFDLESETGAHYCTWVYNLPTNLGVSGTFCSRLVCQHLSGASRDLATLTFDLGGHSACRWCGSSCCILYTKLEVRRPSRSEDIGHLLHQH